jgi:DNA primase
MPRIAEKTIQQVLAATDIVELIGRVVKLRGAGSIFVGLCPFHSERTPSFSVSPKRKRYHCFGCGEGGDAVGFVMKREGLSFDDAVRRLAHAAGIQVEMTVEGERE